MAHKFLYLALIWTFSVLIASLISMKNMPKIEVPGKDKTIHFIFYSVLTFLWYLALQKKYKNKALKYIIALAVIIYGIIIEVLQGALTQNREMDFYDVMANSGGALLALIFIFGLNSKNFEKKV